MEPVLSPAHMAAADARTIAGGTPEAALIGRAAAALAWEVRAALGGTYGRRAVVVCGKGNNGADGRVAAGMLREWGMGVAVVDVDAVDARVLARLVARCDVAIDAMYGTGFRGTLGDGALAAAGAMRAAPRTVAVDIPSGVDGLTGAVEGEAVHADLTVCFAAWKPGLLFEPGRSHAGRVRVVDIGIPVADLADAQRWTAADVRATGWRRAPSDHKWTHAVCVVAGSLGMTGAARLAAGAAQRAGVGMVLAVAPGPGAAAALAGGEVVARAVAATASGGFARAAGDEIVEHAARCAACVVGPGIGRDPETVGLVADLLARLECPVVLDADGLHALGGDLTLVAARRAPTVLTPHDGEYARLMGRPVGADRLAAAGALAAAADAIVVLKGPTSVIAAPDGRRAIVDRGGAELATAGTGDVLSGVIAAALAGGAGPVHPWEAVSSAVWLHAAAGAHAGRGSSTVAGDVVDALPSTLAGLAHSVAQPDAR